MILEAQIIKTIQKIFARQPQVLAVYIFGSQTAGFAGKESDLDLAVVVENKSRLNKREVLELLSSVHFSHDLDVSVVDKATSPLFLFEIINNGQRIYTKDQEKIVAFESRVLDVYYDTQHLRHIYRLYLKEAFVKGAYGY